MKKTFLLIIAIIIFIGLCITANATSAVDIFDVKKEAIKDGVSQSLAQKREQTVSDVKYSLRFFLPADKATDVRGEANITLNWSGTGSLILDFCGKNFDGTCMVNGKQRKATWANEHIIIPGLFLKKGENRLSLEFVSADKPLNRNNDYLYTLLVPALARSLFPCFDQPSIKARYSLSLEMPTSWKAISTGVITSNKENGIRRTLTFSETEPLPSYLFSFTAGKFEEKTVIRDGREISCLYRETDPQKVAQLETVMDQVALSLRWLEDYTGIRMPFSKYGFVAVPGYQFGGMEHPGAIQFNDQTIFLGPSPTPDEQLKRFELIAHETAHLWFGDLVTMRWFNDVWTKEVFANYFAAKISREQFPDIDHDLSFLKSYQTVALSTDRTEGTHPIQQLLENLNEAGLLYGNIIYDKAPVMMRKLEEQMGSDAFKRGIRRYLQTYSYGNATWDALIDILDTEAPNARLKQFSDTWVKQKGMPTITTQAIGNKIIIKQSDKYGRGLIWQQRFKMGLLTDNGLNVVDVNMQDSLVEMTIPECRLIIPNIDGRGYGRFTLDTKTKQELLVNWSNLPNVSRLAAIMTLYENYWTNDVSTAELYSSLVSGLSNENNPLIASTCCSYISELLRDIKDKNECEQTLYQLAQTHELKSVRQTLLRKLYSSATSEAIVDSIYNMWKDQDNTLMNERDYMSMAYHLALVRPAEWREILDTEATCLTSDDRKREFTYVSRACNPDTNVQDSLFVSLYDVENRRIEPWTARLLALLNDPVREPYNNWYIMPGLDIIYEIQKTGDIFFPTNWLRSLLGSHRGKEGKEQVEDFLSRDTRFPEPLLNKIRETAFGLLTR